MSAQVGVIGVIWGRCPCMSAPPGVVWVYVAAFLARVRLILCCLVLTRGGGVIEPVVSGWNLLPAMPPKSSSSNGEGVVKPKLCRTGQTKTQGASPKVRVDKVKTELRDEKVLKNMWQTNYETLALELKRVFAERDAARAQLKLTEKTSAARLVVIKNEVPNFAASCFKGRFDCYYYADLSSCG